MNTKPLSELCSLLASEAHGAKDGYSQDKETIKTIFNCTQKPTRQNILARLTIIDSMYSTQMNRRYYALEELADALLHFTKEQFIQLASDHLVEKFSIINKYNRESNLFSGKYGIGKDGKGKGIALSLITKYIYFFTDCQFPIYDSIACEMFPIFWELCGGTKRDQPKLQVFNRGTQTVDGMETMKNYLNAINLLRSKMDYISYDNLDRILWSVGKIRRGNLSLILSRQQYEQCINYLNSHNLYDSKKVFDISRIDSIDDLPFLERDTPLYHMFCLAKQIEHLYPHSKRIAY